VDGRRVMVDDPPIVVSGWLPVPCGTLLRHIAFLGAELSAERDEIERLLAENERLRAAGDALAEVVCSWHEERIPIEFLDPLTAWEQASRD